MLGPVIFFTFLTGVGYCEGIGPMNIFKIYAVACLFGTLASSPLLIAKQIVIVGA